MAGYILELLHDLANDKLDSDTKCDIIISCRQLLKEKIVEEIDIKSLVRHLRGEVLEDYSGIIFLLARLEERTGYTDSSFVDRWLARNPEFSTVRYVLIRKMRERGRSLCPTRYGTRIR